MGFLRFYGSLFVDAVNVLISSVYWWVDTLGVMSFFAYIISSWNPAIVQKVKAVWHGFIPGYLLVPIIALFIYGVMKANYDRFTVWETKREDSEHDQSRIAHLNDLRNAVLIPMATYLDNIVLPVLDRKVGNVILTRQRVPKPSAGFMEEPTTVTETFELGIATEPPTDPAIYPDAVQGGPIRSGALYEDARNNHFPGLIRRWEHLLELFDQYDASCLEYVTHLREAILQGSSLPELGHTGKDPGRWIYANGLALIVFYRHLGLQQFPLEAELDSTPSHLHGGSQYFAQGSVDDIKRCVATLEALYRETEWIDRLNKTAAAIRPEAVKAKEEVERALAIQTLPGRCQNVTSPPSSSAPPGCLVFSKGEDK